MGRVGHPPRENTPPRREDVPGMIGGLRNTADLRAATRKAALRLQAQLEREMHERKLPIPFIRDGVLYRRSEEGTVAVS